MSYYTDLGLEDPDEYKVQVPPPAPEPEKGLWQTIRERASTGLETLGVGTSIIAGASPETVASDVADTKRYRETAEEAEYKRGMAEKAQAFTENPDIGTAWDIAAHLFSNKKQLAGEVAQSVGMSAPGYAGAAAGAAAGSFIPGVGTVVGGVVGYLLGNLATNVQAEIAQGVEEKLSARGVDLKNVDAVSGAIKADPDIFEGTVERALARGGATTAAEGIVDLVTLNAAKILKPATSTLQRVGRGAVAVGAQGGAEGLGAAAADLASGDPMNPGQYLTESAIGAFAEGPVGIIELATHRGPTVKEITDEIFNPANDTPEKVMSASGKMVDAILYPEAGSRTLYQGSTEAELRDTLRFVEKATADAGASTVYTPGDPNASARPPDARPDVGSPVPAELPQSPPGVPDRPVDNLPNGAGPLPDEQRVGGGPPVGPVPDGGAAPASRPDGVRPDPVVDAIVGRAPVASPDVPAQPEASPAVPAAPGASAPVAAGPVDAVPAAGPVADSGPTAGALSQPAPAPAGGSPQAPVAPGWTPVEIAPSAVVAGARVRTADQGEGTVVSPLPGGVAVRWDSSPATVSVAPTEGMQVAPKGATGIVAPPPVVDPPKTKVTPELAKETWAGMDAKERAAFSKKHKVPTGSWSQLSAKAQEKIRKVLDRQWNPRTNPKARENYEKSGVVDPEKDTLMQAIARLGGINRDEALARFGLDKPDLQIKTGTRYAFHRNGRSIDDMRQALIERGYLDPDNFNDLDERIDASLRGNPQYTARALEIMAEREALENEQAEREYWEAQEGGTQEDIDKAQDELRDADDDIILDLDETVDDNLRTLSDEEAEAFWNEGATQESDRRPDEGVAEEAVRANQGREEAEGAAEERVEPKEYKAQHDLGNGFTAERSKVQPSKWTVYRDGVFHGHAPTLGAARGVAKSFDEDASPRRAGAEAVKDAGKEAEVVDPATLPKEGPPGTLTQRGYRMVSRMAALFGKKVVLFRGSPNEGFVNKKRDPHTIYLNVNTPSAHGLVVAGHEAAHLMRQDHPDLYNWLKNRLKASLTGGNLANFARNYYPGKTEKEIYALLRDPAQLDHLTEEFIADLFGNRIGERQTFSEIFNTAMGAKDQSMIFRVGQFLIDFINELLARTNFRQFATDSLVKDLQAAKKDIRKVIKEYAARQNISPIKAEFEMMRAQMANRNQQSAESSTNGVDDETGRDEEEGAGGAAEGAAGPATAGAAGADAGGQQAADAGGSERPAAPASEGSDRGGAEEDRGGEEPAEGELPEHGERSGTERSGAGREAPGLGGLTEEERAAHEKWLALWEQAHADPDYKPAGWYGDADNPLRFVSGLSRTNDFTAALEAGGNVGVQIGEMSDNAIDAMAKALVKAGNAHLFVDSGAFGKKDEQLDFDKILDKYERLQGAIDKYDLENEDGPYTHASERVFYVMPDVYQNQAASLEVVERYADKISDWVKYGFHAIVPIQKGELTPTQVFDRITELVGQKDLLVGVPSVEEAFGLEDLRQFLKERGDNMLGLHFLGAGSPSTLQPRLNVVKAAGFDDNVSADAGNWRSKLKAGNRRETITEAAKPKTAPQTVEEVRAAKTAPVENATELHPDAAKETLVLLACSQSKLKPPDNASIPLYKLYTGGFWQTTKTRLRKLNWHNVVALSGKFGMVPATKHDRWYDEKMTKERANELIDQGLPKQVLNMKDFQPGKWRNVIIVGSGEYGRVWNALVRQMQQEGILSKDARIVKTKGEIGYQKQQLGKFLAQANATTDTATPSADSDVADSDVRMSTRRGAFYSALEREVGKINAKAMPAAGWKQQIGALAKNGKIKQDEIEWTGLNEFLDLQQGKVTKEAVESFLTANGVQVTETMLGGEDPRAIKTLEQAFEFMRQSRGYDEDTVRDNWGYTNDNDYIELANNLRQEESEDDESTTKYGQYQLKGGKDYKELLLTLPALTPSLKAKEDRLRAIQEEISGHVTQERYAELFNERSALGTAYVEEKESTQYRSGHWDQKNIVAHVRFNTRTDPDGGKVLFIEEIQSDWAQEGKKVGFKNPGDKKRHEELARRYDEAHSERLALLDRAAALPDDQMDEFVAATGRAGALADEMSTLTDQMNALSDRKRDAVPAAPFVQKTDSWVALALKRMIAYGTENGFDKIAFVNGKQSADRYRLSNQIDTLDIGKHDSDKYLVEAYKDENRLTRKIAEAKELPDLIGKELADRVVADIEKSPKGFVTYSGLDLEIGGEGMKAFYDQIVPKVTKDVLKKLGGGPLTEFDVSMGDDKGWGELSENVTYWDPQPGFDLAPLKAKVEEGLPLFSTKRATGWNVEDSTRMEDFQRKVQDKHVDLKVLIKSITDSGVQLSDELQTYQKEELYHKRSAKQIKDFELQELKPLVEQMQAFKISIEDLDDYLHNRHAPERNRQIARINPAMPDKGSGIATQDALAYLAKIPAARKTQLDTIAKRVDAMIEKTNKLLVSSGLEKQSTIDAWKAAYKHYVPLKREDMGEAPGTGRGFSVRGNASRRAMGSEREVADIFANIAMQRERTIIRAEKDKVSQSLWGLAANQPHPEFWAAVDPKLDPAGTAQLLIDMGMNPADAKNVTDAPMERFISPSSGLVTWRVNPRLEDAPNVVSMRVNGEQKYVVFNINQPRGMAIARAMKNLDPPKLEGLIQTFGTVSRYFASINTQWNPLFGPVNMLRDVQASLVNLSTTPLAGRQREVSKHLLPALYGVYKDLRDVRAGKPSTSAWAKLHEELQNEGGTTGYKDMFANSGERADALRAMLDPKSWTQTKLGKFVTANGYLNAPAMLAHQLGAPIGRWLTDYNEALENATRLAVYKVAKDMKLSNQQAASIAKNISVNFNRKGEMALQAGALYAFFNASVQGSARLAETLKGPMGKRIIQGGLTLGVVQAVTLMMAGFGDDEPPDFIRERNIIIPVGDGKYVTIPMPLGLHVIPNVSRILTEYALGGFKKPVERFTSLFGVFADAFNPIGNAGLSMQTVTPTALDPVAALLENKDWSGRQIAREDFNALKPTPGHTRAKDTASVVGKTVSEWANFLTGGTQYKPGSFSPTPDQVDYVFGQVFGGIGREALKINQTVKAQITGEELPWHKVPGLSRFFGDTTGASSQANRYYENLKTLNEHKAEIEGRKSNGENYTQYMLDNPEARYIKLSADVNKEVTKLRKSRKELLDKGADPGRVQAIELQITNQMKRLNNALAPLQ